MKILLDTHIFLWFISGDTKLSADMQGVVRDPNNDIYLSAVSIWEAIVKYQLGKLPLPEHPGTYLPKQRDRHQIASLALDEGSVTHWILDKQLRSCVEIAGGLRGQGSIKRPLTRPYSDIAWSEDEI